MSKKAPLPASCATCAFFQAPETRCRRHAPGTGFEALEITVWPRVKPIDRCGVGQTVEDGTETTACGRCIHWCQPDGKPIIPNYRQGKPTEWWENSGFCTRFAPGPSADRARRAFWRVTHATDRCGDGEDAEAEDNAPLVVVP